MTRPFNRVIDAVAAIATKLGVSVANHGDRLADNLEAIAGSDIWSGGGGVLVANFDAETHALDKTWQQIFDADYAVILTRDGSSKNYSNISNIMAVEGDGKITYYVGVATHGDTTTTTLTTDSPGGYPSLNL